MKDKVKAFTAPVRAYLNTIHALRIEGFRLDEKVKELETKCTKITAAANGVPSSGGHDTQALWAVLADEQNRYTREQADTLKKIREIESFVNRIPNKVFATIIKLKYLDDLPWRDVHKHLCNDKTNIYFSERTLFRLRDQALIAAQKQFDEENK